MTALQNSSPRLGVVVPCLNEEESLPSTCCALLGILEQLAAKGAISPGSFILFVDDGSSDCSWEVMRQLAGKPGVKAIRLSRNYGHQEALVAGLGEAQPFADAIITLDADLQDDPSVIGEMLELYSAGADVVYGVRRRRPADGWFKKNSAGLFYSLLRKLGVKAVPNHADYRLLSNRAVADLLEFGERNIFLRGIVPLLGYRQETVTYDRAPRRRGTTKYPLSKMLDFAADGITSFSVRPVRMLFWIGVAFILTAIGILIYVMCRYFGGETIEGWTSLMLSIWFCTGVLLMGLGIIGEYIGKIYIEVKQRPRFRISDRC